MIVIHRHTECERGVSQDERSSSSSLILCSPISVDPSPSLYIYRNLTQQPKNTQRKTNEKPKKKEIKHIMLSSKCKTIVHSQQTNTPELNNKPEILHLDQQQQQHFEHM